MPRALTTDELLDRFLSTAPKERLIRLRGDLDAVLRWKHGEVPLFAPAEKRKYTRKKTDPQAALPLAKGEGL